MFFLVCLNILTKSIAITDSMFNFGKFFTKNAITFDLTKIEKKNIFHLREIFFRIQWCHQIFKNRKKENQLFLQFFF